MLDENFFLCCGVSTVGGVIGGVVGAGFGVYATMALVPVITAAIGPVAGLIVGIVAALIIVPTAAQMGAGLVGLASCLLMCCFGSDCCDDIHCSPVRSKSHSFYRHPPANSYSVPPYEPMVVGMS